MLAGLSLDMPVNEQLAELVRGLDVGWEQLAERLEEAGPAPKISIEVQDDGRVKLNVDKLSVLGEPKSLTWLRKRVETMLPRRVRLPRGRHDPEAVVDQTLNTLGPEPLRGPDVFQMAEFIERKAR